MRLFAICTAMKWSHLPWPGGLYDQHPKLLDDWVYIFQEQNREQDRKDQKQKAEMERNQRNQRNQSRRIRAR